MENKPSDYQVALSVIHTHINKGIGTRFTRREINEEIIEKGGILRVSFYYSTRAYLQDIASIGMLEPDYLANEPTYEVVALELEGAKQVVANRKHVVEPYEDPHSH